MSNYPNILTPPGSEDSPQSMYYNRSPSCMSPPDSGYIISQQPMDMNFGSSTSAPYLEIIEQPIDRFRFRYKSEMTGTHGSLCGMNSDKSRKQTYPTIKLCNFDQPAVVRCSIYQYKAKSDNMPHAHRLVKKYGKDELDDPHDATVSVEEGYTHIFHSMGIIHTAKKNIVPELIRKKTKLKMEEIGRLEGKCRPLTTKEEVEIKGLAEGESKSINLNVVVLRFDAFVESSGVLYPLCEPVFSHGINNLKSALTGELKIVRMDHCTSPTKGNREIFILVERVTKKNIRIRFFELDDEDQLLWEDYGKFSDLDVHHQYAIVFKTPPYKNLNITNPIKVFIELLRPSDRARSEPKEFIYIPSSDHYKPGAKRSRPSYGYGSSSYDSSLASDELPLPINNLCLENNANVFPNLLEQVDFQVNSEELHQALTNINSDEFNKIFNDFGPEYMSAASVVTDAPDTHTRNQWRAKLPFGLLGSGKGKDARIRPKARTKSRNVAPEESELAKGIIEEVKNFMKTRPSDAKVIAMLHRHLGHENRTNVLHIAVKQNDVQGVLFFLKLLYVWKQNHLMNVRNDEGETALHIATYCNNEEIINNLVDCKADVSVADSDQNTPLHVAVLTNASTEIVEKLLSAENVGKYIDTENDDGNTALNVAIENNNLKALKLLCMRGADINRQHMKSGYTPLRFAIEKPQVEMIQYILSLPDIDPAVEDFQGKTPFHSALKKDNEELMAVITDYMKNNGYCDVEIKEETEEFSEDEIEEKFAVKLEPITSVELRHMYNNVKDFTPECLDQVAEIIDRSESWASLADLLDLGHLFRTGFCDGNGSPTKTLLKAAIETNGDTVLQIRDFLDNLDEQQAVDAIDTMVKSQFM